MIAEEQLAEIEEQLARTGHGPGQRNGSATLSALVALRNHAAALIAGCREAARLREVLTRLRDCVVARSTVEGDLPWTGDVVEAMKLAAHALINAASATKPAS